MTSLEERRKRVQNGSRRKRDLAAVDNPDDWARWEEHAAATVPEIPASEAVEASSRFWLAHRRMPNRAEMLELL